MPELRKAAELSTGQQLRTPTTHHSAISGPQGWAISLKGPAAGVPRAFPSPVVQAICPSLLKNLYCSQEASHLAQQFFQSMGKVISKILFYLSTLSGPFILMSPP